MKKLVLFDAVGVVLIALVCWLCFFRGGNQENDQLAVPILSAQANSVNGQGSPTEEIHSIFGRIVERGSGIGISGATVRATNQQTAESFLAQSNEDGNYKIILPASGQYMVTGGKPGFGNSSVPNVAVNSEVPCDIEVAKVGDARLPISPGNPDNYVFRNGVHDEATARAAVAADGYLDSATVAGPITYTNIVGKGDIAYRDGQAVSTYRGNINGPAWAVPLSTGTTIYVMVECGNNVSKVVVEVVVVMPPPPPPVVIAPSPAPCCVSQPTDTPCPKPSATPKPTKTPVPTATPKPPVNTLVPPTATLVPSATPLPTATRVPPTLHGSIRVEPDSGFSQILDADIVASVTGGTATGPINYFFDCTSDGIWEKTVPQVNATSYRAVDLCDYPVPGDYVAVVLIERDGVSGGASAHILVLPPQ